MVKEIEQYIVNNYNELQKICIKITNNSDWAEDLLQNVLLQLYEKKEIKLYKLDDNSIKYYIVKCLTINWFSTTSPFYRKVRKESTFYTELFDTIEYVENNTTELDHMIMESIEEQWLETNWFNKIIFQKYLTLGSLKKVSQDTTIPLKSIWRYVNETKNTIKENTLKKINEQ